MTPKEFIFYYLCPLVGWNLSQPPSLTMLAFELHPLLLRTLFMETPYMRRSRSSPRASCLVTEELFPRNLRRITSPEADVGCLRPKFIFVVLPNVKYIEQTNL